MQLEWETTPELTSNFYIGLIVTFWILTSFSPVKPEIPGLSRYDASKKLLTLRSAQWKGAIKPKDLSLKSYWGFEVRALRCREEEENQFSPLDWPEAFTWTCTDEYRCGIWNQPIWKLKSPLGLSPHANNLELSLVVDIKDWMCFGGSQVFSVALALTERPIFNSMVSFFFGLLIYDNLLTC